MKINIDCSECHHTFILDWKETRKLTDAEKRNKKSRIKSIERLSNERINRGIIFKRKGYRYSSTIRAILQRDIEKAKKISRCFSCPLCKTENYI